MIKIGKTETGSLEEKESKSIPPRLELFSDALFAILITIMVLEIRPPHGHHFSDLIPMLPIFLSYILSFVLLLIYWNNHHHLLRAMRETTWKIMWSNALLLFLLSLVPFTTAWMGESNGAVEPTVVYGVVLILAALAYTVLQAVIISQNPKDSLVVHSFKSDLKGKLSVLFYLLAIILAFVNPVFSYVLYAVVALMWIIPRSFLSS